MKIIERIIKNKILDGSSSGGMHGWCDAVCISSLNCNADAPYQIALIK